MTAQPSTDASELIARYDEERPARRLTGWLATAATVVFFLTSAFVLRQVFDPLSNGQQYYLMLFLGLVLPMIFIGYRGWPRRSTTGRDHPGVVDWVLAAIALVVCLYPILPFPIGEDGGGGFDAFLDRQGQLSTIDVVMGTLLLVLVLEACRRTTGWILPIVCVLFLLYAYYGGYLPTDWPISHAGVDFAQIINGLYNDASGFYGTPLDVCATYIVLFTIYGAVLDMTGAGRFFIEISFAAFRRSRTAPGRTVAMSGFLLGTVSGSGTATAVSLGSVAWPILRRAGYPKENAGGMLAAAGIGAILSPPTLGAAAFIIAEYLQTSYLQVLVWAIVPTLLYYLGIILAVEIDARRFGAHAVDLATANPWRLLARFGYHFLSLAIIVVFLALDIPPFTAVVYATIVAAAFGLIDTVITRRLPQTTIEGADEGPAVGTPGAAAASTERLSLGKALLGYAERAYAALATGVRSVLPVAAVCAAAGVITSVITKTGLGQELADLLVSVATAITSNETGVLILTVVFSALAILVLGLAVPVTASFIISWVIIGPALLDLGVAGPEAAMFIFYYAVLSEVSPPTALAAVAASAITGGRVMATIWQACKYTLPAFLVPIAFVLTDNGGNLLSTGSFVDVLWVGLVSAVAVVALALVAGGWMFGPAGWPERALCIPAAVLLLYLSPLTIAVGFGFGVVAVLVHLALRGRRTPEAGLSREGTVS